MGREKALNLFKEFESGIRNRVLCSCDEVIGRWLCLVRGAIRKD